MRSHSLALVSYSQSIPPS